MIKVWVAYAVHMRSNGEVGGSVNSSKSIYGYLQITINESLSTS